MRKQLLVPIACAALLAGLISLVTRPPSDRAIPPAQTPATHPVMTPAEATAATAQRRYQPAARRTRLEPSGREPALDSPAPPAPPEPDPLESIEPAKRPLIIAIRDRGTTPIEKRRAMLQALADSGKSAEGWTAGARHVFENWRRQLPGELRRSVELGDVRCYRAGCAVDVVFQSEAEYRRAAESFPRLKESGMPHGGRVQTPIEPRAGAYGTASWIMLSPTEEQLEAAKGV